MFAQAVSTTKTLWRRFFALAGRITRKARRLTLHLPQHWPDCAPCHCLPDHTHRVCPPTELPNRLTEPRQAGPRVSPDAI